MMGRLPRVHTFRRAGEIPPAVPDEGLTVYWRGGNAEVTERPAEACARSAGVTQRCLGRNGRSTLFLWTLTVTGTRAERMETPPAGCRPSCTGGRHERAGHSTGPSAKSTGHQRSLVRVTREHDGHELFGKVTIMEVATHPHLIPPQSPLATPLATPTSPPSPFPPFPSTLSSPGDMDTATFPLFPSLPSFSSSPPKTAW
ncbi:hypothetical protein E2C01_053667 [Portunus trituberculatus]|uniref:Uncharacterized protein n=1 Tax=Portunus trituberculatus TaxID=210409 RepID=A0A5B7GPZ5_PORTR|nr:hypothetical protein [Portunus trituberculatus]